MIHHTCLDHLVYGWNGVVIEPVGQPKANEDYLKQNKLNVSMVSNSLFCRHELNRGSYKSCCSRITARRIWHH